MHKTGAGFCMILVTNTATETAVDEFCLNYPALSEMSVQYVWFRPMMNVVAQRLMKSAPLGLKLRVTTGVLICLGDLASDIFAVDAFMHAGKHRTAHALMAMLGLTMLLQIVVVVLSKRNQGWRGLLPEILVVLLGLKAPWDAYHVFRGDKRADGVLLSPLEEMMICRAVEVLTESVPGGLLQTIGFITLPTFDWAPFISIAFSCLATAHLTSVLSFDIDTDVHKRAANPTFYGYVPNTSSGRSLIFGLMVVFHGVHVTGQMLCMAVLYLAGWIFLAVYIGIDVLVFLAYKVVRRDFYFWGPGFNIAGSIFPRVMIKLMTLVTGCLHLRHPFDLGGGYWAASNAACLLSWFVAIGIYDRYGTVAKVDTKQLYALASALAGAWLLSGSGILLLMNREYVRTFYSLQSGCDAAMQTFTAAPICFEDVAKQNKMRAVIFEYNERMWHKIRGDVERWVKDGYPAWKLESPSWLTSDMIGRVPDEWLSLDEGLSNALAPGDDAPGDDAPGAIDAGNDAVTVQRGAIQNMDIVRLGKALRRASLDVVAAPAVAPESSHPKWLPFYRCDYHCGFTGTYQRVAKHESTCAKRTDASGELLDGDGPSPQDL